MGLCKVGGARRLLKHRLIRKFIILFPVVQEGAFFQTSSVWFLMRILAGPGDHFVVVKKKKIMLIRTAPYPNPTKTNLDQAQSISTYFLVPSTDVSFFFFLKPNTDTNADDMTSVSAVATALMLRTEEEVKVLFKI